MNNQRIVFARGCGKPTIRAQKVMEAIFIPKIYKVQEGLDYRHFRSGKIYKVLYICKDAKTNEYMVVYRAQHGDLQKWVRPLEEFCEFIDRNGYRGPRFMEVKHG